MPITLTHRIRVLALMVSAFVASARADVRPAHAMNVFRGEYKVVIPNPSEGRDDTYTFTLGSRLEVNALESSLHTRDLRSSAKILFSPSVDGPNGLPVLNLLITSGSDEDTWDLHLRLTVVQNYGEKTLPVFLDLISTFNDGPNESSTISRLQNVRVLKKQTDGTYKLLATI